MRKMLVNIIRVGVAAVVGIAVLATLTISPSHAEDGFPINLREGRLTIREFQQIVEKQIGRPTGDPVRATIYAADASMPREKFEQIVAERRFDQLPGRGEISPLTPDTTFDDMARKVFEWGRYTVYVTDLGFAVVVTVCVDDDNGIPDCDWWIV
ncbi:hypothetical protein ACIBHY_36505 [Nonomuraea sp. NPDC050547]|uniref:hypothetical protein n=1 Tax=unclassified Nonomuraea TaxID=2593643 RepID=UPI00378DADAE